MDIRGTQDLQRKLAELQNRVSFEASELKELASTLDPKARDFLNYFITNLEKHVERSKK